MFAPVKGNKGVQSNPAPTPAKADPARNNISSSNLVSSANTISKTIMSAINRAISLTSDPELEQSLQDIKNQLPKREEDQSTFKQWWKKDGHKWTKQLKDVVIKYRDLEYDWQLSEAQLTLLEQYYRANHLLVECLNSECNITTAVRHEIEGTLLLSVQDIKQYEPIWHNVVKGISSRVY